MDGEPWTYNVLQGQSLLDSCCKGKCFKAGLKEWTQQAVLVITVTWWQDTRRQACASWIGKESRLPAKSILNGEATG